MATNYLYIICKACEGTGEFPDCTYDEYGNPIESEEPKQCDQCDGNGKYLWGYLEDELLFEE